MKLLMNKCQMVTKEGNFYFLMSKTCLRPHKRGDTEIKLKINCVRWLSMVG